MHKRIKTRSMQKISNKIADKPHFYSDFPYRVRYADVDQMGYMYYGNYARLYEIGRVEAIRNLGLRYRDFEDAGVMMPVYENTSRYLKPIRYDELIQIRVHIRDIPKVRIVFSYEIFNEEGELVHTGETTLVFVEMATNKIIPTPKSIIERILPFFSS
jgi:acyl-CoA thioester hydrolase